MAMEPQGDLPPPGTAWAVSGELHKLVVRWNNVDFAAPDFFAQIEGEYIGCGYHDARQTYKKCSDTTTGQVDIYYCGVAWKPEDRGWWIGQGIGSDQIFVRNPLDISDIPSVGWLRMSQSLPMMEIVPKMVLYKEMYETVVVQFGEYTRKHPEATLLPRQPDDALRTAFTTLSEEHDELKARHELLLLNYKQALKDKHLGEPLEKVEKVATVVPPPLQHGMQEYVSGASSASSSVAAAAGPPPDEVLGRTRSRTRAGVRVQAQRIVDLFVNERYSELARAPTDQRYHW
jgi:hypothetical protein